MVSPQAILKKVYLIALKVKLFSKFVFKATARRKYPVDDKKKMELELENGNEIPKFVKRPCPITMPSNLFCFNSHMIEEILYNLVSEFHYGT